MICELKGNFLGCRKTVSKTNGNTYYHADVYCEDGETVSISIPEPLDIKKFSEIDWRIVIRNTQYGMKISLAD